MDDIGRTLSLLGLDESSESFYDAPLSRPQSPLNSDPFKTRSFISEEPSRALWIGNIDPSLDLSEVQASFSPFGPIDSLRLLTDRDCAFVNYAKLEDAIAARRALNGSVLGACVIRIGFARPDKQQQTQQQDELPTKSLWVGNIPASSDPAKLEKMFARFGPIESARVLPHKNCGFVNFVSVSDAIEAKKEMNGLEVDGMFLKIGYAKVPSGSNKASPPLRPQSPCDSSKGSFLPTPMATPPHGSMNPIKPPHRENLFFPELEPSYIMGSPSSFAAAATPTKRNSPPMNLQIPTTTEFSTSSLLAMAGIPTIHEAPMETNNATILFNSDQYASSIPPLPEPKPNRLVDQNRLREMRKKLEGHCTAKDVEQFFTECVDEAVDLATDYIGNVVLQKIIEKGGDPIRLRLIEQIGPHMAAIGIHKNGTWVVQKMIDLARTTTQIQSIVQSLKPFTPPLLLDQFGNYVVQCCLRLGTHRNQFVFDAMHKKCVEVGHGRFGARAMRACLESQYTTKRQQKHVAISIVQNAVQLCTNPNGAILVTWLLDSSSLPGRYRVLAPKLAPHLSELCTHKLASATMLKLVNQRVELDARDLIIRELFFADEHVLQSILADQSQGIAFIQKILASACVSAEEKIRLADRVRGILARMNEVQDNTMSYKRLLDELASIPSGLIIGSGLDKMDPQDVVSPLTPHSTFFSSSNAHTHSSLFMSHGISSGLSGSAPNTSTLASSFIPFSLNHQVNSAGEDTYFNYHRRSNFDSDR